jgi:Fusaric acid resistance protein family
MSGNGPPIIGPLLQSHAATHAERFEAAWRAVAPSLLFVLRLWTSGSLALYVAYRLELDNPYWAGATAAIVCQPQLGASLRKGWFRMIGTVIGAAMSVVLVASFPQDRILFLGGLAVWCAACAFVATLLRNFASYTAALAGYTWAIIAGDLFGAVGGVDANAAFLLAVSRATEICLGVVCAGIVLAGTDFGGARRRLAAQFADLSAGITAGFTRTLASSGREFADAQPIRREFLRRVVALDPLIDQTIGESAQIRYHSPVLQSAVDGLFTALSEWRAVASHLRGLPPAGPDKKPPPSSNACRRN